MTGVAIGWQPFKPSAPEPEPNDHRWLEAYKRRATAATLARSNVNLAAEAGSQNGVLARSWTGQPDRSRALSDEALVARWYAERGEQLGVIERAQRRGRAAGRVDALLQAPRRSGSGATVIRRTISLDDIRIIARGKGGDGRTVEAYAAVFGERAEIQDAMGHYFEEIDPRAFDDRLAEARRGRGGLAAAIKCVFNHGMTRAGTPSDKWSLPVGTPQDIRPDSRGLLTVTRYTDDDVLDRIKSGAITSQSFAGECQRSSPERPRGRKYGHDGRVPVVRRLALGLREYGPVLWPAYSGAEITAVRSGTGEHSEIRPAREIARSILGIDGCPQCDDLTARHGATPRQCATIHAELARKGLR